MRFTYSLPIIFFAAACGDNIRPATDAKTGDGPPPIDAPVMCDPNEVVCDGDDLVTCDANGMEGTREPCAIGCNDTAMPKRCKRPVPSNLAMDTCATPGAADLTVAAMMTTAINTADANCDAVVMQAAGLPKICVKKYANVSIAEMATVNVAGPNALAIVATGTMTVDGIIDASSTMAAAGPGGATTPGAGMQPATASAGGGGAGHLTPGGIGGISALIVGQQGGMPGAMHGSPENIPNHGGSRGGNGGPQAMSVAQGGFGGGALQLASCTSIAIGASAILDAGGGGGAGGNGVLQNASSGGGAGGGSGGSILVEAPTVAIAGGVFANGGGGGSGGAHGTMGSPGADGNRGEDGPRSTMPAQGGPGVIVGSVVTGKGGNGGAAGAMPEPGGTPTAAIIESSGGGGGAAGRIRFNVKDGTMADVAGATVSPAATEGAMAAD